MTNRTRWLVLTVLLPAVAGCEIVRDQSLTAQVWLPAGQTRAVHPTVGGLVRNCPRAGDQALVVNYRALGDDRDLTLLVPLDAGGNPVGPFAATGQLHPSRADGHDYETEVVDVPDEQRKAVVRSGRYATENRDTLRPHLTTADWHPAAGSHDRAYQWFEGPTDPDGVCVLAFRIDAGGHPTQVMTDHVLTASDRAADRAAGKHRVLLPVAIDRPAADRSRSTLTAAALTPVTAAADLVTAVVVGTALVLVTPFFIANGIANHGQYR